MKRTEELIHLNKKIHFESKIFPLISQSRWLVRHGELVELAPPTMPAVSAAKPKLSTKAIYLHVFNDCLLLSRKKESEKQRWISAMCPSSAQEDKEAISENEDLPQVQCIRAYKALEPDELTLEKADILAVRTRTGDGWLEGIRLADGERGWVPQAYVDEITSRSARLRNIWETRRIESATNKLQETAA
ncbi:rho guanine nucleotide exchange factor 19-like isoform X2 [Vombatus ursinus]|nr:rho guanine nucleotide exchange factor 19-like isoform X2 [Vombatus ursinus]